MVNRSNGNQIIEYTGVALEDRVGKQRTLKVYVEELLPAYSGKIEAQSETFRISGGTGSVTATNYITADYFEDTTNRGNPPDIKVGEFVTVLKYADNSVYFWKSSARSDNLRRTERHVVRCANTPDNPVSELNDDNTYQMYLDTTQQNIVIRTSKSAGESFQYLVKLDAAASRITVCDDAGNEFTIESEVPRVMMRNKDGCVVDLAEKNFLICAPEDGCIKTGRQLIIDTPTFTFKNDKLTGATQWDVNNLSINSKGSVVITAPSVGLKSAVEANTIVSGNVFATSYSTISGGSVRSTPDAPRLRSRAANAVAGGVPYSTYVGTVVNIITGRGTTPSNPPNDSGGGGSALNRYCAAWDQVNPAFAEVADNLVRIDAKIGYGNTADVIVALATQSRMPKNRGE